MKIALTPSRYPHVLPSVYDLLRLLLAVTTSSQTVLGLQTTLSRIALGLQIPVLGPGKAEGGVPEGPDMGAPMLRRSSEL